MQDNLTSVIYEGADVPGYQIDTRGNVYSTRLKRFLKSHTHDHYPYKMVSLRINDKQRHFRVHVLLMHTFKGPKPFDELMVDHIDRDPTNNSLDNLRWVTRQINNMNREARGYQQQGNRYVCHRILPDFPSTCSFMTPEDAHEEYKRRHDIKFTRLLKELAQKIAETHMT